MQPPPTHHPPTAQCTNHSPTTHRPTHNSSTHGSTPVRKEHVVGSGVLRKVRNAGRLLFSRPPDTSGSERAATHQAPTTHPPTYPPQQYNSSTAVRTDQSTTAAQQCSSTQHSSTPGTRGPGWGVPPSYDSPPSRGVIEPSPGETFHASRFPNLKPSAVVSPGTRRGYVRGGSGTGVRWLGAGWRPVERVTLNEYWDGMFLKIP